MQRETQDSNAEVPSTPMDNMQRGDTDENRTTGTGSKTEASQHPSACAVPGWLSFLGDLSAFGLTEQNDSACAEEEGKVTVSNSQAEDETSSSGGEESSDDGADNAE